MHPIEIQFFSVFIIVAIIVVFIIFTVIKQWHKNNRSPKIVINSTVLEKRKQRVSHSSAGATGPDVAFYGAEYWITFQLEGGDSVEFWLKENEDEYNRLKIGDCGKLTFQGTRYLGFEKRRARQIARQIKRLDRYNSQDDLWEERIESNGISSNRFRYKVYDIEYQYEVNQNIYADTIYESTDKKEFGETFEIKYDP